MRARSTVFFVVVVWSVLMATMASKAITPLLVQTFQTVASALETK